MGPNACVADYGFPLPGSGRANFDSTHSENVGEPMVQEVDEYIIDI